MFHVKNIRYLNMFHSVTLVRLILIICLTCAYLHFDGFSADIGNDVAQRSQTHLGFLYCEVLCQLSTTEDRPGGFPGVTDDVVDWPCEARKYELD